MVEYEKEVNTYFVDLKKAYDLAISPLKENFAAA